ncbi:Oidioi.mRNA.OKI2018_I69.XSR.g14926.t1.cds [Oikopleura dioica]|uniref:D-aminoacyl-tRNA deacylase n=1 Tax=Oikopleura dioica TaxID=34765 RepID=A0ABN7SBP6_OIKDI|nr:Oidioi.mRNA.OKI2018_I69.XSR.g14926.t1.cds [Oikopleura dioica]
MGFGAQGEVQEMEYVTIEEGLVVFVCFREGVTDDILPKIATSVLSGKLYQTDGKPKSVESDEAKSILVIPQATLGGKLKGKQVQYHGNISKLNGEAIFEKFRDILTKQSKTTRCEFGTYGNRQVLQMDTEGPFSHVFEF